MTADEVAKAVVAARVAPEVAAAAAVRRGGVWRADIGGDRHRLFDLASVTKPMTAVAIAALGVPRTAALGSLLPVLDGRRAGGATVEALLSHRAGLVAHLPLYLPLLSGAPFDAGAALAAAADGASPVPSIAGDGPAVYSDLGYMLAGAALAHHAGVTDAGEAIAQAVVRPLALERELGSARALEREGVDVVDRAAPTEDVPWRGGLVRGRVHDENAWALSGAGASGHAGLFGTAAAVVRFGCAVLDALDGLSSPWPGTDFRWLVEERPGGTLRAGFDGKSREGSSAGARMGPRAFGHLGFTGTSLWIDPDAAVVVALLTNRVCPSRDNGRIRDARPWAHDALFDRALTLGEQQAAERGLSSASRLTSSR